MYQQATWFHHLPKERQKRTAWSTETIFKPSQKLILIYPQNELKSLARRKGIYLSLHFIGSILGQGRPEKCKKVSIKISNYTGLYFKEGIAHSFLLEDSETFVGPISYLYLN